MNLTKKKVRVGMNGRTMGNLSLDQTLVGRPMGLAGRVEVKREESRSSGVPKSEKGKKKEKNQETK